MTRNWSDTQGSGLWHKERHYQSIKDIGYNIKRQNNRYRFKAMSNDTEFK